MNDFHIKLTNWYKKNKRELPWRQTKDPYKIWVSEIILQQTRVNQGIDYYRKFLEEFPDVYALAESDEEKVLKVWQGLGYYSRARNMHKASKHITKSFSGKFPHDLRSLKEIPGIGDYTAAAISSIVFGNPDPVVDGNVYRVLSRLFAIDTFINTNQAKKQFTLLSSELMSDSTPGIYNQALMEFGALQCTPKNPDCTSCVFSTQCESYINKTVKIYPRKKKKTVPKERFFNYLVIYYNKGIYFQKRNADDIWKNLYEFPLIETEINTAVEDLILSQEWKRLFGDIGLKIAEQIICKKHKLTHRIINARFIKVEILSDINTEKNFIWVDENNFKKYATHKLIASYIDNYC